MADPSAVAELQNRADGSLGVHNIVVQVNDVLPSHRLVVRLSYHDELAMTLTKTGFGEKGHDGAEGQCQESGFG